MLNYFFRLPAFRAGFALRDIFRAAAFLGLGFDFFAADFFAAAFGLALAFFAGLALAIARAGRLGATERAAADGGAVTTSDTGATSTGPFMNGRPMSATTADVAAMSFSLSFLFIERTP
jgi:hypothetical protein